MRSQIAKLSHVRAAHRPSAAISAATSGGGSWSASEGINDSGRAAHAARRRVEAAPRRDFPAQRVSTRRARRLAGGGLTIDRQLLTNTSRPAPISIASTLTTLYFDIFLECIKSSESDSEDIQALCPAMQCLENAGLRWLNTNQ